MVTAFASEKPPLGQKPPPAWLCLKKRRLSTGIYREKCRYRLRPTSGAPVFANGAVTSAMAFSFGQGMERQRAGRSLTENEIETFGEIFGESLDYEKVRVKKAGFFTRFMEGQGIVTGNTVNISADIYQVDFALANLELQAFFAHELTHVWQYQNVSNLTTLIAGSEHIRFRDPYGYSLDNRQFDQYRFEQQGGIVQDYYRYLNTSTISPYVIQRYEQVIYGPGGIKR